jgi:hypothetical protein
MESFKLGPGKGEGKVGVSGFSGLIARAQSALINTDE